MSLFNIEVNSNKPTLRIYYINENSSILKSNSLSYNNIPNDVYLNFDTETITIPLNGRMENNKKLLNTRIEKLMEISHQRDIDIIFCYMIGDHNFPLREYYGNNNTINEEYIYFGFKIFHKQNTTQGLIRDRYIHSIIYNKEATHLNIDINENIVEKLTLLMRVLKFSEKHDDVAIQEVKYINRIFNKYLLIGRISNEDLSYINIAYSYIKDII